MTGKSFTTLSKIFASALLGAGLLATCAAASPGHSAAAPAATAPAGVTLTNPGDQVAKVLPETVSLQLSAKDSAGGALTYTATGLPPGTSIDPATGLISGSVTDYYDGTASVTATDAADASATVSFNWLAENAIFIDPITVLQNLPDSNAEAEIQAGDADRSEPLAYSATGLPPGLSINAKTGYITGETGTVGSYAVTVTVSDPTGSSASISFTWRIWNKVTVSTTGLEDIQDGAAVSVPTSVTDSAPGQTFTFSAVGLPTGLSINPASGLITGIASVEGVYTATVTATDSTGAQGSSSTNWDAFGKAEIASPGNLVTTAGQLAQIPLKVSDTADNAWLYYRIAGGPPGSYVNWDPNAQNGWRTATLTGWPAPAGTYKVTVSLIDNFGGSASVAFTWTVKPASGTGPTGPVRSSEGSLCLDDTNNSSANGNKVQVWSCNGDTAQNWTYAEDGTLRIHGKCLDDTGYGTKAGTKLQLWSCLNHTNQMWTSVNAGELQSPLSGLCMTAPYLAGSGTQTELGNCGENYSWTLPAGEIMSGIPDECITDSGAGTANGTKIVLERCANGTDQRWTVQPDGTIRIFGKCLVLSTAATGSGAVLWSCGAGHMQQWGLDGGDVLGNAILSTGKISVAGTDSTYGYGLESPPGETASGTQIVLGPQGGPDGYQVASNAEWHVW